MIDKIKVKKAIEENFKIINKQSKEVPFLLNPAQQKFLDNLTGYDIILKARQEGFSSLIIALFTYDFLFVPNSVSMSLSYETKAAEKLLDKAKLYIKYLDIPMKYNSRNEMYNEIMGSTFYIGTAGALTTGRGSTINNLHCSEIAFYKDAQTLMTGLLQAVPKDGNVILESTANGIGNYYHTEWTKGVNGDGAYHPHFFSWSEHKEYALPVSKDFKMTPEEVEHLVEYNLTREQIAWRREKIKTFSTMDEFNQEYPITPEIAFISSGNPVFNLSVLSDMLKEAKEPKYKGNLLGNKTLLSLEENSKGYLDIWDLPNNEDEYVIGADVAEVDDYSVAQVVRKKDLKLVARFRAKLPVDAFAKELERLGYFYNTALLGVERNNQGIAVLVVLNQLYYPNMFYREDVNDVGESSASKLGWETSMKTRPILITDLAMYIRNRDIKIFDKVTIRELMSFVRTEKKPMGEAQAGTHDDTVMALGIAIQMYRRSAYTPANKKTIVRSAVSASDNNFDEKSTAFDNY